MKRSIAICLLLAGTVGAALPATAQTVYRCGETYSQQPCPGGKPVQADDPRTEAQRAQTRDAAQRDAKVADEMQKARLRDEARPAQAAIPAPKPEALDVPDSPAARPGVARKPAHFTAVSPKKKDKAQPAKKKNKAKKASATGQSS